MDVEPSHYFFNYVHKINSNNSLLTQLRKTTVLKDYYSQISTYLMETFGANFIWLTIGLTTAVSIVYFIVISYSITQMDKRYFIRKTIADEGSSENPHVKPSTGSMTYVLHIAKIIAGVFLLVCGLAMLVLPGQGLITIVIALSLLPFPGKHTLEQKLLSRKSLRSTLNWIRIRAHKDPFIFD